MKEIRHQYETLIKQNFEANRKNALEIKNYLEHSSVAYHGRCVHTLHIPKVFTQKEIRRFQEIVSVTYGIFEKVIREYLRNPEYRKSFPFSPELEELILVPNLYDSVLPIARFDIFFDEDTFDFKFCEINTDGTSAMNEDFVLNQAIRLNITHQEMAESHTFRSYELFDTWVETMLKLYRTYEKAVEKPYIAIVDFLEHCSITEFEEFQRRFERAGYACEICEITELTYRDHTLYSPSGRPIDLVYRRAVTTDVMQHYEEVQPFIEAVKHQDVCVMGSFCTQIIHNKWLFKILREEPTLSLLDEREQKFVMEHIPYTNLMDSRFCREEHLLEDKDRYNTVYAAHSGSAAAPTAGLHFTPELLEEIQKKGVDIARVTLHVGLGTFRPVKVDEITDHHMHSEFYQIGEEAAEKINRAKENGHRVICVGTTSCRTIESAADENGHMEAKSGWTEIFIYPGYRFKVLDCLITNFHLPESTLIMLVSALAGREHVLAAYEEAVKERYRFFSFGDAMLIR